MSSLSDHSAYREAKAAVGRCLSIQHSAEIARLTFLQSKRGVPVDELYHRHSGDPKDTTLIALTADVNRAVADVAWCRSLVIACGEVVKGCTFEEANRSKVDHILGLIDEGIAT